MNRDVYNDIFKEIEGQKHLFERFGQMIHDIAIEEGYERLESFEASFEFFVQRMLFAFRNEAVGITNLFRKALVRAGKWEEIKNISEREEYDSFLDTFFSDIINSINEIMSEMEKIPKNEDKLGLSLIVKNEGRYLPEWIEYHKAVGINRFFIYDNESTDDTKEVLKQYIDEGSVTYTWCPGKMRQFAAYSDALDRFRFEVKYMGFIDADEFILPVKGDSVPDLIEELFSNKNDIGGVVVTWRVFGSDGHMTDDGKPVIGSFLHRAENSFWQHQHFKTICNPRVTLYPVTPHNMEYVVGYFAYNERGKRIIGPYDPSGENGECSVLQLNHYYVKSREYWINVKMKRGFADAVDITYEDKYFGINDRNEVEDLKILKYLPVIEQNLRKRGFLNE